MANKNGYNFRLLPFEVIKAAASGDVEAIYYVLKHYEGYIAKLATRQMLDKQGQSFWGVDEELRMILETTLSAKILKFDVNRMT